MDRCMDAWMHRQMHACMRSCMCSASPPPPRTCMRSMDLVRRRSMLPTARPLWLAMLVLVLVWCGSGARGKGGWGRGLLLHSPESSSASASAVCALLLRCSTEAGGEGEAGPAQTSAGVTAGSPLSPVVAGAAACICMRTARGGLATEAAPEGARAPLLLLLLPCPARHAALPGAAPPLAGLPPGPAPLLAPSCSTRSCCATRAGVAWPSASTLRGAERRGGSLSW